MSRVSSSSCEINENKIYRQVVIERGALMSVYYSVLSEHWGGRGGRRLETMYFVTFGGTLSKSPIDGDLPAKIGTWSPNGCDLPIQSPAGVSMFP